MKLIRFIQLIVGSLFSLLLTFIAFQYIMRYVCGGEFSLLRHDLYKMFGRSIYIMIDTQYDRVFSMVFISTVVFGLVACIPSIVSNQLCSLVDNKAGKIVIFILSLPVYVFSFIKICILNPNGMKPISSFFLMAIGIGLILSTYVIYTYRIKEKAEG